MSTQIEDWKHQASFQFGTLAQPQFRHMYNVRGSTAEEFAAEAAKVEQIVSSIRELGTLFSAPTDDEALELLQKELGAEVVEEYPAPSNSSTGRVCHHGQMTFKSSNPPGKWSAWMCPARQGDPTKCQPIDGTTGKPWPRK